ncbi:MAG TPA: trypsin-like serine protease, partial [Pyrinomonadaceae bacterium]|nr:trypsin-like serine protease [Pyrinomonadaceae bacterium]
MQRSRYLFLLLLVTTFGAALLIAPSRSSAITYGFVDTNNTYSNVGAFIVKSPTTGNIYPICSGTLISSNVFLTASHCTSYYTNELAPLGYTAYVSFDKSIPFGDLTTTKTKLLAVSNAITNP